MGGRERGRVGGRERGRVGGRERGREGGREGGGRGGGRGRVRRGREGYLQSPTLTVASLIGTASISVSKPERKALMARLICLLQKRTPKQMSWADSQA